MLATRLIVRTGTRVRLCYTWPKRCPMGGLHVASITRSYHGREMERAPRGMWAVLDDEWPPACDKCLEPVPDGHPGNGRSMSTRALYGTVDGKPQPGDMFWRECSSRVLDGRCPVWDDCDGEHLIVCLPDGSLWDLDSRADNCTLPTDRAHRCWPRAGTPPLVTVAKPTPGVASCGCGHSILTPGYHGFLTAGVLVSC